LLAYKNVSVRAGLGVLVIVIVLVLLILARNNFLVRPATYNLFHFLTGQETKFITAQLEEIQTTHYVIKYQPIDQEYAKMVGEVAEEAYTQVTDLFDQKPIKKTTVVIYPDTASLALSFGWDRNEKALGVYYGGTIRILSPGAYLPDENIKASFAQEGPMVHEFTHLMVDDISRGNYSRWWTEGIAQYVEKKTTGFEFSEPFAAKKDVQYYSFNVLTRDFDKVDQSVAYWQSLKVVEFIAQQYGEQSLLGILNSLGQHSMDEAIRLNLGINLHELEQEFGQYIEQNY
jgi:hypothetical protein